MFNHLKKSILAFKKVEDDPALANSYLKRTAFSQYFHLANDMNNYEKENYDDFLHHATFTVNSVLKKHILKLEMTSESDGKIINLLCIKE